MSIDSRPRPDAQPSGRAPVPRAELTVKELAKRVYGLFYNKHFGLFIIMAMAVAVLLGVVLPQALSDVAADPQRMKIFLDEMRPRYRGWTEPLAAMGMFTVFQSWWFMTITVLLTLSIIACTAHRFPNLHAQAMRPKTRVTDAYFDHARVRETVTLPMPRAEATAFVKQQLHKRHFRTITDDSGSTTSIYSDHNRWAPYGTVVAHLAFIVILAGVFVTSLAMFRITDFTVTIGSKADVGQGTGLTVEAVTFKDTYNSDGSAQDYVSDLILYHNGVEVKRQLTRVNAPLRWNGWSVNQAFFGVSAEIEVVQVASGRTLHEGGVALQYETNDKRYSYGKFSLPEQKMLIYVITPASGQNVPDINPGEAQIEVYRDGSDTPMGRTNLRPGEPLEVGGLRWTFQRERQFTGLMVMNDPGAPIVWTGSILLVIGVIWTFFIRQHRIWVRISSADDSSVVAFASPDRFDSVHEKKWRTFFTSLPDVATRR